MFIWFGRNASYVVLCSVVLGVWRTFSWHAVLGSVGEKASHSSRQSGHILGVVLRSGGTSADIGIRRVCGLIGGNGLALHRVGPLHARWPRNAWLHTKQRSHTLIPTYRTHVLDGPWPDLVVQRRCTCI